MYILTKHKKKGEQGFKDFVCSLETTPASKLQNIIQICLLEDPLYMKFILPNMINYEFLMAMEDVEIDKVWKEIQNPEKTFILAFHGTPFEKVLVEQKLNNALKAKYLEEKTYMKDISSSIQGGPRFTIVKTIRQLQARCAVKQFPWKVPDRAIMDGSNIKIPAKGLFGLDFDDGKPALRGQMEDKLRAGIWKHFYPTGTIMAEGMYNLGEKVDHWVFYYADGKKKAEGEFKESLKAGDWAEYDKDGTKHIVTYNRGQKAA